MSKEFIRKFNVGETVYVIESIYIDGKVQLKPTEANIIATSARTFDAQIYSNVNMKYANKDFGRIIFNTYEEAAEAINNLPQVGLKAYMINDKKYVKEYLIQEIKVCYKGKRKIMDLYMFLQNPNIWLDTKLVLISEIGKSVFLLKEIK